MLPSNPRMYVQCHAAVSHHHLYTAVGHAIPIFLCLSIASPC
jgi:hypothetical protein